MKSMVIHLAESDCPWRSAVASKALKYCFMLALREEATRACGDIRQLHRRPARITNASWADDAGRTHLSPGSSMPSWGRCRVSTNGSKHAH
jgi:hypothetical protein